jgi:hypothetical protein
MKKVVFILVLIVSGTITSVKAQDVITMKKDGSEIRVKVTEIDADYVKYLPYGQDSPVYHVAKADIFRIQYANGTIEVFGTATPPPQTDAPAPVQGYGVSRRSASTPVVYKKGYVGVKIGPALSGGENHSTTVEKIGIDVSINAGYLFAKHFGVTATFLYASFGGTDYLEERSGISKFAVRISGFLAGPLFSFAFSDNKFELDIRPSIGSVRELQTYKRERETVDFKGEYVLAYGGGPSFRWNVHRSVSLSLNVDTYYHAKMKNSTSQIYPSSITAGVNFRF